MMLAAPQVTSGPEGVEVFVGQPMTLACEGKGFPVPSITWEFVGADGALVVLPGDDSSISVQIRGGPEALMVSSWVQINQGRRKDRGTYSCVVTNYKGSSRALAEVSVKT
ncbi:Kazal type serine protease inhibitor [Homalodisca vitripennis]|nr:Kazal type serine protease inhibitor [Homalodisca vitripennis]